MPNFTITVNMDAKCAECRKGGATDNKLCLRCSTRAMVPERVMKSEEGRAVQARWQHIRGQRLSSVVAALEAGYAEAAQPARVGGAEA